MKKKILSLLLVAVMLLGMIPAQIFAADAEAIPTAVDTSWYDPSAPSGTVFEIEDAADLRGAARLSHTGVTFSGYTLKLTANIDLNPGWNAEVVMESGKAVMPEAPTVEFEGFATFAGTLDGNGKTLSGIYMMRNISATDTNLAFIEYLSGTVKNIVINNSLIFAGISDGVNNCKIAGIAARAIGGATRIDTVYADINVWYRCYTWERIAGIVAKAEAACTVQNVAFVGSVGNMTPSNTVPSTSTGVYMSQLVADGGSMASLTLTNCSLMGTEYANVTTGKTVATGDAAVKTNVLVGADVAMPDAVAAMNPTSYTGSLSAFNIWPSATADSNTASYDESALAYVKYYSEASESNYTSYLATLESNGYVKCGEYTVASNKYALYQKSGAYSVFVSYLAKVEYGKARMRVFVEPFGTEYDLNTTVTSASVCTPQLWQLDVDNATADGGMSYVIRLTDGTFIIIDGGYNTAAESKNLYKILANNNVNGGKPVIRAWFLTHLHGDHYGGLSNFARNYASSVTVEGFYYNFPENSVSGTDSIDAGNARSVETSISMFGGAARYGKIHSGMTFGFAGVSVTVLGTHEDVHQSYYRSPDGFADYIKGYSFKANEFKDGNDTSTVLQLNVAGQKITMLADARTGMSKQLEYSYPASVLKSDIVQMAHHGYTGCEDGLYEIIDAPVVLWPMDVVGDLDADTQTEIFKSYLNTTSISANKYVRANADEIIPSFENVCLDLPYVTGTYSGNGKQTVDLEDAYNEKLYRLATESDSADTSWYSAGKSTYYIYNANDLMGFAELAAAGDTFSGKTVMLMANIDLNPGWSASVTVGDKIAFPTAPVNTWPNIATFKGTLDGNGYEIRGLYTDKTVASNTGAYGGLFNTLDGTVKNLKIDNSFVLVTNNGLTGGSGKNVHVGGIAGDVNANATLANCYFNMEVWFKSEGACMLGGVFGLANGQYNVTGLVTEGRVGNTDHNYTKNYSTCSGQNIYVARLISCQNFKDASTVTNSIVLNEIHTGTNNNATDNRIGIDRKGEAKLVANTPEDQSFLNANRDYAEHFAYTDVTGFIVPKTVLPLIDGSYKHAKPSTVSTFNSGEDGAYLIYTAAELLSLLQSGGDFAGKTIKLMANIDLNPGWNANVTVGSTVSFPSAPANSWPNIATFKGTFDGNGYTLSGLYKSMTVSSNKGAYGGMFNTLNGGTVKNLRISNSLVLTTNTSWGSGNIHVGGISGNVETGSVLSNVYMDESVEIWFKSKEQCVLGGAFGYANGAYSINGFIFAGTIGNTNLDLAASHACASSKPIYIATIVANSNGKSGTVTNSLGLSTSIHSGKNYNTSSDTVGVSAGSVTSSCVANERKSEAWLTENPDTFGASFVWSDAMNSIVPKETAALVNGTYQHEIDMITQFATPEIFFQVSDVEDGTYSIRFVSGIDNIDLPTRVGFDITLYVDGVAYRIAPEYTLTPNVYTSVLAAGKTVTAEDLNTEFDYLYTCSITDVAALDSITVEVAVVYECNGTLFTSNPITVQFLYGVGQVV